MTENVGVFQLILDWSRVVVRTQIPGEPQAWMRAGRSGKRMFDPPENKRAKKEICEYLVRSNPELARSLPDRTSRFGVVYLFATNMWTTDLSNYVKVVEDAVNKFVYHDDRQIDETFCRIVRGVDLQPRSEITIYLLPEVPLGSKT